MLRLLPVLLLISQLSACAFAPDRLALRSSPSADPVASAGRFNFDWQLSGSRAVAPLQVFDDGRRMWLQFSPGQAVPAIFERSAAGDRPLHYSREGAYLVLPGVWPELVLRGGSLQSHVRRKPAVQALASSVADTRADMQGAADSKPQSPPAGSTKLAAPAAGPAHESAQAQATSLVTGLTAGSFAIPETHERQPYSVDPSDINLRLALMRWARAAGWTFAPEHWAVDVDIPLTASASFDADFKLSVQALVAATELADRPLQPCFYSNMVLRIVPYAQPCDRNANLARAS